METQPTHDKGCHDVYLGLGSNLGDKEQNIRLAIESISSKIGKVMTVSALHETKPVDFDSDNMFLNAACWVQTKLSPLEILGKTQEIETLLGRTAKSNNGIHTDRTIDIDILMYDDTILNLPQLILPHPHLHQRTFVLYPLAEIAENVLHPILHKTIGELSIELKSSILETTSSQKLSE